MELRPAFLLIELMILLLLITFLSSLFIGGQATLLKMQSDAAQRVQLLTELLNERERLCFQAPINPQKAFSASISTERYAITNPTITGDCKIMSPRWMPKAVCFLTVSKQQNKQLSSVRLTWIASISGDRTL